jgi:ribosome maturation factor RimP
MSQTLEEIVAEEVERLGYDLVEFRRRGTGQRPLLDVRIDRRDGGRVTVDDCATASRAIEARLDGAASVGGAPLVADSYVLEVSSPGLERPLRTAADWRRFAGRRARVNSPTLGGAFEVDVVGVEGEPGAELAVVREKGGDERRIAFADIKEARLVFEWKR